MLQYITSQSAGGRGAGNFSVLMAAHAIGNNKQSEGRITLFTASSNRKCKYAIFVMLTLFANRLTASIYELLWFQVLHIRQCCVSLALR